MADLFKDDIANAAASARQPLAERLRPKALDEVVGQQQSTDARGHGFGWLTTTVLRILSANVCRLLSHSGHSQPR